MKVPSMVSKPPSIDYMYIYTNTQIGFAIRGDGSNPSEKEDSTNAEDQAVNWFNRFID